MDSVNCEPSLFQPLVTGNVKLKNRFVRAAANEKTNDAEQRKKFYSRLASAEVALIYTGGLTPDKFPSYSPVADVIHSYGSKFAIQLIYPNTYRGGKPETNMNYPMVSKLPPDHPFFDGWFMFSAENHEMADSEIWDMIKCYSDMAKKAVETGADFIGIHSSHHNILAQFLSPLTNTRKDKWGGSIENRTRVHGEIIKAIRTEIGSQIPVIIKLGIKDSLTNGLTEEDGLKAAEIIARSGYDIIELSQGLMDLKNLAAGTPMRSPIVRADQEIFFKSWAETVKKSSPIPVMVTGGVKSFSVAEDTVSSGKADLLGLCRPLLCEPDLVKRWHDGNHIPAKCTFCNKCLTAKHDCLECVIYR